MTETRLGAGWRGVAILVAAQAFAGAGPPINMATAGLAASTLLGDAQALATVPVTAFVIGSAASAAPAALLQARIGRRLGLFAGLLVGVAGALVEAGAMVLSSFWLLVAGSFLVGAGGAFIQQFRFAAADVVAPERRSEAISLVLAGGVASAVIGPQAALLTADALQPFAYAGAFLSAAALTLLGALFLLGLRAPPPAPRRMESRRTAGAIAADPRFRLAAGTGAIAYALMSLVMTAAPLAMVAEHHHPKEAALLGIQWHVVAMFAPSFITGHLIRRFGANRIVSLGLALLAAASATTFLGTGVAHSWAALVLLGIGWNFGFIGATSLVAEAFPGADAPRAQAMNEVVVLSSVALASLASGGLLALGGWRTVNTVALVVAAATLAVVAARSRAGAFSRADTSDMPGA